MRFNCEGYCEVLMEYIENWEFGHVCIINLVLVGK